MASNKDNAKADDFRNEGNSFYKKGKFEDALISYNKSLCFALPDSQQLGLAYANRSAIYLELYLFKECQENIQLARDNKYPNKKKLFEREQKCRELKKICRSDPDDDVASFFKLSYPANEKIPFIVNCLELRENKKYGRHIITNRDLNPGDVIAIEESFSKIVHPNGRYKRCSNCFKSKDLNLIPCSGKNFLKCSCTMFCNQECLNKARWQHCTECDPFCELDFPVMMIRDEMTLLRIYSIISQSLDITQSVDILRALMNNSSPKTIFDFDLNINDQDAKDFINLTVINSLTTRPNEIFELKYNEVARNGWNHFLKYSTTLKTLIKSKKDEEDIIKYTTRLFSIFQNNAFGHRNGEGSGILPFGSLFNHSCDPNIDRIEYESKPVFVVRKPVAKNDQLFITYGLSMWSDPDRESRRANLMGRGFECTCTACVNNYIPSYFPRNDPGFVFYLEVPKRFKDAVKQFKKNCNYIKKNFKLYPSAELHFLITRNVFLVNSFGANENNIIRDSITINNAK